MKESHVYEESITIRTRKHHILIKEASQFSKGSLSSEISSTESITFDQNHMLYQNHMHHT